MPSSTVNITRLPAAGPHLFGREAELAQLDRAWTEPECHLIYVTGEDGLGKTSLIQHWLDRLHSGRPGLRVYGWSFYSQGSVANQTVAADFFIDDALRRLGDADPARGLPWERGRRLARLLREEPTLLILDGLELLQPAEGPEQGRLQDPALLALLRELSEQNPGLAVVASRLPLPEPAIDERKVRRLSLAPLPEAATAALLRSQGIEAGQTELHRAADLAEGQPLAMTLLAGLVREVLDGDLRRVDEIPALSGARTGEGPARRVLQAWAEHLAGGPERDILRLVGLFLRPTDPEGVTVLRTPPSITGLTDRLFTADADKLLGFFGQRTERPLKREAWEAAVDRLRRSQLLLPAGPEAGDDVLDAHPVVRKFFARQVADQAPRSWYRGHERLYRFYQAAAVSAPETLPEMEPLYTALAHGCRANKAAVALEEIYLDRIVRKDALFSWRQLGAFGADLAGLANCFRRPWQEPIGGLPKVLEASLLNWAGSALRGAGRLAEAGHSLEATVAAYSAKKRWKEVAVAAVNLSQLRLSQGQIEEALALARQSMQRAKQKRDAVQQMVGQAAEAVALHQAGRYEAAATAFAGTERQQQQLQRGAPLLYSQRGYQYCDLLLSQGQVEEVKQRAEQTLAIAQAQGWALPAALDQLSLGRAYLAGAEDPAGLEATGEYLESALTGLQQERALEYLVPALLARADWYRRQERWAEAQADVDEALDLATRTGMRLFACDAHLGQAQLALARRELELARAHLEQATALIEATGYGRREEEAADLQAALDRI